MADIFLIHWNEAEAQERAERIRAMGHTVRVECADGARGGGEIRAQPPAAVVIDLSRLPSHGRETADWLHGSAGRRETMPIVFLPGEPEKMEAVQQAVPSAVWSTWDDLAATLAQLVVAPLSGEPIAADDDAVTVERTEELLFDAIPTSPPGGSTAEAAHDEPSPRAVKATPPASVTTTKRRAKPAPRTTRRPASAKRAKKSAGKPKRKATRTKAAAPRSLSAKGKPKAALKKARPAKKSSSAQNKRGKSKTLATRQTNRKSRRR